MSTDFSIKPVGTPAAAPVVQPSSAAAHKAVATELPARQSVTVADVSAGVRNDVQQPGDHVSQAFIDQAAATIVYQIVDKRTAMVVEQYPEEAVLRRRAYFHALDLSKSAPARPLATDRTA
jgi:uncharacterized FlaG/YvyC family protein